MALTETVTQCVVPMDYVLPSNAAAASYNSASPIDMAKFHSAMYVISVGAIGGSATLDARLQSSATNFGTAHNISQTNITQITAANAIVTIEVRSDQITGANAGDRWLRLNTTVGTAALNYSAVGYGFYAPQKPGNQYIPAAVTQQVVCGI